MATVFQTNWIARARAKFLAIFAENIMYQPGILNRTISAMVKYVADDAAVPPISRHRSPQVQIKVANDSQIGISAAEFEPNQTVSVPPRPGAAAKTMQLARIVKHSAIWVTYECH